MKIVIDIPESYYNLTNIQNGSIACGQILKAVKNGKPYDERPQGKWENDDFTVGYTCSVCGSYRVSARVDNFKFCPDCGADMREEGDCTPIVCGDCVLGDCDSCEDLRGDTE